VVRRRRPAGGWFDHRTSREGDPLLHTHLVVANRVQGPDGRWTALDGRDLYRHRCAADAVYRAAYQRALTRSLGVEWTAADRWGNRELYGVPAALVRAFSKRAEQVTAEVERLHQAGRERTPRLVKWAVVAQVVTELADGGLTWCRHSLSRLGCRTAASTRPRRRQAPAQEPPRPGISSSRASGISVRLAIVQ
jgi:TrwC relaxase